MSEQHILNTRYDGVLEIRFNRLAKKNAITPEMYQELNRLLDEASADKEIKIVYFRGDQGCFSAGNDVADLAKGMQTSSRGAGNFMTKMIGMRKPMVAAVSGPAIGIGATLLFQCDLIYVDETAMLVTPFVQLGVCPEAGASYALPSRVGPVRAAHMLLRNAPVGAKEAVEMGLVNEIIPAAELYDKTAEIAKQMAALPAESLQTTKELMRGEYAERCQKAFDAEMQGFARLLESPDAKKAFEAFLNK